MTVTGRKGARQRKRHLNDEDRALWETVTRSVKPLRRRAKAGEEPVAEPVPAKTEAKSPAPKPSAATPVVKPPSIKSAPPPLAPLGRRARQRVARGSTDIDARIDLHGMTQDRAHAALLRFLRAAQAKDAKLVLVITGKGARAEGESHERGRGVLRRMAPQWLALPEFRSLVVGFEAAHVAHGGEGALYVRMRRRR
jgi:DNA-nicking Smr family endonuclease